MLKREDVLSMGYLKKTPFKGSYRGMRFMLQKAEDEGTGTTFLRAWAWPEPYSFEHTDEGKKLQERFPFDETGVTDAIAWLNKVYEEVVAMG